MANIICLLFFLVVHVTDQVSDVLTALIYLAQGLIFEGCATLGLVFLPGLVVFCLEAKEAMLGRGHLIRGLCLLLVCPVYTWIVLLYSLQNTEWREKAMFLVIIEGFLSSSPQLLLQLSLWFKGVLTLPAAAVIDGLPALQENITHRHSDFQFLGRSYDEEGRVVFGMVQLVSILISLTSVLASGIYFNDLETGVQLSSSRCRKCIGVPFFLTTILHRAVSIALVICFLEWWSSLIIFGLFFLTVLMSVCAGDLFSRACAYGVWSQLLPVGFARDPLESLGYKVYTQYSIADTAETQFSSSFLKRRAKYFICSHLAISTGII